MANFIQNFLRKRYDFWLKRAVNDPNADIERANPIIWAVKNGKQIDGKDAITWAKDNGVAPPDMKPSVFEAITNGNQIYNQDAHTWAKNKNLLTESECVEFIADQAKAGNKINGVDAIVWAKDNSFITSTKLNQIVLNAIRAGQIIDNQDAYKWAKDKVSLSESECTKFITDQVKAGNKINGVDAIVWAKDNSFISDEQLKKNILYLITKGNKIDSQDAHAWAKEKKIFTNEECVKFIAEQVDAGNKIGGKDAIAWAKENSFISDKDLANLVIKVSKKGTNINNKDALIWAKDNKLLSESDWLDILLYKIKNETPIEYKDPYIWANENKVLSESGLGKVEKEFNKNKLNKELKAKTTGTVHQFDYHASKKGGLASQGEEVKRDDSLYLRKDEWKDTKKSGLEVKFDMSDSRAEYMIGALYKNLFLYDQAPEIQLMVKADEVNTSKGIKSIRGKTDEGFEVVHITSKFFSKEQDFKTLAEFPKNKRSEIKGFEKVFAACIICGEGDPNYGNIGVINKGTVDKPDYFAVKIDHGKSGRAFKSDSQPNIDERALRGYLISEFTRYSYWDMPFELDAFKSALDQMVKVGEDQIKTLLETREYNLKQAGFKGATDDDKAADVYAKRILSNIELAKELSQTLDIIKRITPVISRTKWLTIIKQQDPITFAIKNNFQVDGKPPVEYALNSGVKYKDSTLSEWLCASVARGNSEAVKTILTKSGINKELLFEYTYQGGDLSVKTLELAFKQPVKMEIIDMLLDSNEGKQALFSSKDGRESIFSKVFESTPINMKLIDKLLKVEGAEEALLHTDTSLQTPLHIVIRNKPLNMGLVEKLLESESGKKALLAQDEYGRTPLHNAIEAIPYPFKPEYSALISKLLELDEGKKALLLTNTIQQSPLDVAKSRGSILIPTEIIEILETSMKSLKSPAEITSGSVANPGKLKSNIATGIV